MGNANHKTPILNKLAAEGTLFSDVTLNMLVALLFNKELHTDPYNRSSGDSICIDNTFVSGDIL